jgi:hypothetical protein
MKILRRLLGEKHPYHLEFVTSAQGQEPSTFHSHFKSTQFECLFMYSDIDEQEATVTNKRNQLLNHILQVL